MPSLLYRSLADLFFPHYCMGCDTRLSVDERLVCLTCRDELYRLHLDWTDNFRLESWFADLAVKRVAGFTLFKQGGRAATLIHQLKYRNHPELGEWMGHLAATELTTSGLFEDVDVLIPIPLSSQRLRQRGYNQAEQIARGISSVTAIPISTRFLKRIADRISQTHLGREERMDNATRIFKLDAADELANKHVMVVDDVMTTGTTMDTAIMLLKDVPGINISLFAWAWTME